jgi:hypothetical protein
MGRESARLEPWSPPASSDSLVGASTFFLQELGCGLFQVLCSLASGAAEARLFG